MKLSFLSTLMGDPGMYLTVFIVLFKTWLLSWGVFEVGGGLIHLLIVMAVVSLMLHHLQVRRVVD